MLCDIGDKYVYVFTLVVRISCVKSSMPPFHLVICHPGRSHAEGGVTQYSREVLLVHLCLHVDFLLHAECVQYGRLTASCFIGCIPDSAVNTCVGLIIICIRCGVSCVVSRFKLTWSFGNFSCAAFGVWVCSFTLATITSFKTVIRAFPDEICITAYISSPPRVTYRLTDDRHQPAHLFRG